MEETILKDIRRIETEIQSYSCAERLQRELIAKYRGEIDHIEHDLDYGDYSMDDDGYDREPDYIGNVNNIKGKLEILLAKVRDEKNKQPIQPVSPISLVNNNHSNSSSDNHSNNNNNLSNTNTVDVKLLFEDAKKSIDDDISLNDDEVAEILEKINELEELHNSDERPRGKWAKSKDVMNWVIEKGPKIASTILPLITEVIK
ncbi:MAG: hypothetical protein ACRDD7_12755 [Peptostreptococcaceae bacterium]